MHVYRRCRRKCKEVTCVTASEKLKIKVKTAEISKLFIKDEDRPQNPSQSHLHQLVVV